MAAPDTTDASALEHLARAAAELARLVRAGGDFDPRLQPQFGRAAMELGIRIKIVTEWSERRVALYEQVGAAQQRKPGVN